jgi:hypothetical protein
MMSLSSRESSGVTTPARRRPSNRVWVNDTTAVTSNSDLVGSAASPSFRRFSASMIPNKNSAIRFPIAHWKKAIAACKHSTGVELIAASVALSAILHAILP